MIFGFLCLVMVVVMLIGTRCRKGGKITDYSQETINSGVSSLESWFDNDVRPFTTIGMREIALTDEMKSSLTAKMDLDFAIAVAPLTFKSGFKIKADNLGNIRLIMC